MLLLLQSSVALTCRHTCGVLAFAWVRPWCLLLLLVCSDASVLVSAVERGLVYVSGCRGVPASGFAFASPGF